MESHKKVYKISPTEDDSTQKYTCSAIRRKRRKYKKQKGR